MAELTPFGQSLQAQGGASALLRLQGYTPGTREYKRAYDVLYNLSTGRQKGTQKYANIRAGVEQRAQAQRRAAAPQLAHYPSTLTVSGEIRVSDEWERRSTINVDFPFDLDPYTWDSYTKEEIENAFAEQFARETGIEPDLDLDGWTFR